MSVIDVSWGCELAPVTLCAGVGSALVADVIDVAMLTGGSEVPGDGWEGV